MDKLNLVGVWCGLARAYQLALLTNLSIKLVYDPIKNPQGFEDAKLAKSFFIGVQFSNVGDIIVELTKPNFANTTTAKTLEDLQKEVSQVKDVVVDNYQSINTQVVAGLVVGQNGLSAPQANNLIKLATAIAKLDAYEDAKNCIKNEYIFEALSLVNNKNVGTTLQSVEISCIAKVFGSVEITHYEILQISDIQNAIKYLEDLLKDKKINISNNYD